MLEILLFILYLNNKSITPNYIKWFKDNNINIFIQNNDGERAFDYLSKESKKEAQKLYIEEYVILPALKDEASSQICISV